MTKVGDPQQSLQNQHDDVLPSENVHVPKLHPVHTEHAYAAPDKIEPANNENIRIFLLLINMVFPLLPG